MINLNFDTKHNTIPAIPCTCGGSTAWFCNIELFHLLLVQLRGTKVTLKKEQKVYVFRPPYHKVCSGWSIWHHEKIAFIGNQWQDLWFKPPLNLWKCFFMKFYWKMPFPKKLVSYGRSRHSLLKSLGNTAVNEWHCPSESLGTARGTNGLFLIFHSEDTGHGASAECWGGEGACLMFKTSFIFPESYRSKKYGSVLILTNQVFHLQWS